MPPFSRPRALLLSLLVLCSTGCVLRTPFLLDQMNSGFDGDAEPKPRPPVAERVAAHVRTHMVDGYFDKAAVGAWLDRAGSAAQPMTRQLECLRQHPLEPEPCFRDFSPAAVTAWQLPEVPTERGASRVALPPHKSPAAQTEMDVERFLANARWIAQSLRVLENSMGQEIAEQELSEGVRVGMQQTRDYLAARSWNRSVDRPATALVMSGGAANGAFTAGFVWRVMEVLKTCQKATGDDACPNSRIDLIVGSSTGALVGVTVDRFHLKGDEETAERLLIDNYTCSTERDLYCKYDEPTWYLWKDLKGLMRFNGIEKKLRKDLVPALATNGSELVTLAVDYESGRIFAQSDQDPADRATGEDRVQTVLASIVEPFMSVPVDYLMKDGKKLDGTFIDGGVRSGLPLREAVLRGAERVLVVSTNSVDFGPAAKQGSALPILTRTIDLSTGQNVVGELQSAEFEAATRRFAEYGVCVERLMAAQVAESDRDEFCERANLFQPGQAKRMAATFVGPGTFREVGNSWKSVWINRPEKGPPGAIGYRFDPAPMRELFKEGVKTFQKRCEETLSLLNVPSKARTARYACAKPVEEAVKDANDAFKDLKDCPDDETIPVCE